MKNRGSIFFSILSAIIIIGIIWVGISVKQFITTPLNTTRSTITLNVKPGTTIHGLATELTTMGLLKNRYYFIWLSHSEGTSRLLKTGEYEIQPGMKVADLLQLIAMGKTIQHKITFIEGWTFAEILQALEQNPKLKHTLQGLTTQQIMVQLGHPGENPEGRFFPDTYVFAANTLDIVILRQAYAEMASIIQKQWTVRQKDLPYTDPYQAVIVASMIEKETAIKEERPLIAGVILFRLKNNMLLQIDPTVIYGLGAGYKGEISKADLKEKTPYNTYLNKGLPPGAICMPSKSSIIAALHPLRGNYLYYVASADDDGSHFFSCDFVSHEKAAKQYRKKQQGEKYGKTQ